MATRTINNISNQAVPVLIDSISSAAADDMSELATSFSGPVIISPGEDLIVESERVDLAQLEQLANLRLITYT